MSSGRGSPEARKRAADRYYARHAERLRAAERARYRARLGGMTKRERRATLDN